MEDTFTTYTWIAQFNMSQRTPEFQDLIYYWLCGHKSWVKQTKQEQKIIKQIFSYHWYVIKCNILWWADIHCNFIIINTMFPINSMSNYSYLRMSTAQHCCEKKIRYKNGNWLQ